MTNNSYDGTASLAMNLVVAASLMGGTVMVNDSQFLLRNYQPSIVVDYSSYKFASHYADASYKASVDSTADQIVQMRQLAKGIIENSKGVDAEIGAAVEDNFFDWL